MKKTLFLLTVLTLILSITPNFAYAKIENIIFIHLNQYRAYNLLTGSNKASYIDTFLDRGVNAFGFATGVPKALSDNSTNYYSWFLN